MRSVMQVWRCSVHNVLTAALCMQSRMRTGGGPGDRRIRTDWYRCYPSLMEERERDMYHCYYPYLFDHGDKMSLYPKIPDNPRIWQPEQLQTTYDAIREDKYDAFIRLREKFPELYQDTRAWDNPPPFGEFNMFYSVRFGMVGVKAFTCKDYDELGNQFDCTAFWFPDNQIVRHSTRNGDVGTDKVYVGAMNVPVEFHKPHVAAFYKAAGVPVKHVCAGFPITPDAYAPVGTKLDVRHFKPGQEVTITFQNTDYGFRGVMFRHGFDGGYVWLGDSKWQRRPGCMGTEGQKRIYPGHRMAGQTGASAETYQGVPVWRIDYKNALIYLPTLIDADVGTYVKFSDTINTKGYTLWNEHRGLPAFPTFIPSEEEDLSKLSTDECQLMSPPLYMYFRDEFAASQLVSQADVEDAKSARPTTAAPKKKVYDMKKYFEARKKYRQNLQKARKVKLMSLRTRAHEKQEEARRAKILKYKRVK
ncbi:putative mitochondrial ribosomal protein L3 [Trypanosoma cruzi]|uniref:Large ribosomal subunit protein uL3m n=1 Tax=Trypanosoma cruzi TaxID=5693 RepID=A0A2V2WIF2_TRYCR|nr:putative mitochondrial ribosomal protein L3 [Trypanosoma cruzi]RNC35526.1 putative mitochondrial ribosomal protein L3-like protein [Trypanosoma cruzi]